MRVHYRGTYSSTRDYIKCLSDKKLYILFSKRITTSLGKVKLFLSLGPVKVKTYY